MKGHIFVTSFQLGGQLIGSKFGSSIAGTTEREKRDSMKVSAAVSVESKFASAEASYSNTTSNSEKTSTSSVQNSSALAWNARGGNTLLCAK
jgi:hypothetical protein